MRAIIYCRKSTEWEDRQALSLESQKEWCLEYAKNNNITVLDVIEESKSAKLPWREKFTKMIQLINNKKVNCIITWKLNRLARNPIDEWTIKWALQNEFIKYIYTTDWIFKSWDNVLITWMYFGMATQYSLDLKKDVIRWMKSKLEKWWVVHKAPTWYINDKNTKNVYINNEEAKTIKYIYKLRKEGKSFQYITDILNDNNIRLNWKKVHKSTVERIIRNTFYYGMMKWQWEYYIWNYRPIISKEDWEKANWAWRWSKPKKFKNQEHLLFPFKWIIKDESTWKNLIAYQKNNFKYIYYWTHTDKKENKILINQDKIIKYFDNNIHLYSMKWLYNDILKWLENYYKKQHIKNKKEKKEIDTKVAVIEKKQSILLDYLFNWTIDENSFKIKQNEYKEELLNLQKLKNKLQKISNNIFEETINYVELLTNIENKRNTLKQSQKIWIIKFIVVEIFIDNKKELKVKEKPMFETLASINRSIWQSQSNETLKNLLYNFYESTFDFIRNNTQEEHTLIQFL